ncbi:hypothetical protein ABVV53_06060 [Novosphingobium sp. RD2P27]|uniref:NlpC/P60 domain-containing protein n=1 Tax=Novosphingobium kalidii TaxID=3230299 RepID=A0ABV2CZJ8_9SPHN
MSAFELAAAAEALVGVPFRLHGRDPNCGVDCLGVLAAALARIGRSASLPASHTLRRRGEVDAEAVARDAGLVRAAGVLARGDMLLVRCSATQLHLLIAVNASRFVHAHAGLGRVVIGARDPGWPVVGHWRLPQTQ